MGVRELPAQDVQLEARSSSLEEPQRGLSQRFNFDDSKANEEQGRLMAVPVSIETTCCGGELACFGRDEVTGDGADKAACVLRNRGRAVEDGFKGNGAAVFGGHDVIVSG